MRSELLLLRLEVLRRGIKDVQEVLEAGNALFESIKKAQENVDSAWWFVNNILNVAENQKVIQALEAMVPPDGAGGEWTNELRSVKEGLRQARQDGAGLKRQLDAAKDGLLQIGSRAVKLRDDFGAGVAKQMRELGREIDLLARDVKMQPESADSWKRYFGEIQPGATRLFTEYLDLLGGVSIRERGLAIKALADVCHLDELCALADWHFDKELSLCLDWDKPSVALPGRDPVAEISEWPILRLGFASWSIWGLPLEGHEFGKLIAAEQMSGRNLKNWKPYIAEFGPSGTRALIADTFAAWAEGPAYACALLFLALNPNPPQGASSAKVARDADRAEVVLATLRGIAAPDAGGGKRAAGYGYMPFINVLEKKWTDAYGLDGQELPEGRKRLLQELPGLVQLLLELQKPFGLRDWRLTADVLDKLISCPDVPLEVAFGVRHLTNAAWRGRILAADGIFKDPASNAQASPDQLEQRAMRAGIALIRPRREATPPTSDTSSLKEPRPMGSP